MKCLVYLYIYDTNIAVNNLPEDCEFPQLRYLSMEQNETRYPIGFSHIILRCPALSNLDTSYSYPDVRIEKRWYKETRNRLHVFKCDVNINDAEELYNVKNVLAEHLFNMKLWYSRWKLDELCLIYNSCLFLVRVMYCFYNW